MEVVRPPELDLPHYEVLALLGEGSFGSVFKARQLATNQLVALKVLKPDLLANKHQLARFEREAQICAEINHPYIVKLLDKGFTPQQVPYVVFEYVTGSTLKELLLKGNALSSKEAKELMGQLLDALSCAHAKGIVHRDLKPENIMVSRTGIQAHVKVLDFGVGAFMRDNHMLSSVETSGTPAYSAPEQLRGEPPTVKSDLYAWGLLLLECLTGTPVIQGNSLAHIYHQQLHTSHVPLPPFLAGHPLSDLMKRVLDKNPITRVSNAHKLFEEYNRIDFTSLLLPNTANAMLEGSNDPTLENAHAWSYAKREKRQITVLCAKLGLEISPACNLDEEILEEIMQDQLNSCTDALLRFGGYVKSALAGHLVIYFGYPQVTGSDARLAGRAALEVISQMRKRSDQLFKQNGIRVVVQIALHTGNVMVRQELVPEGITANVAFHLLYESAPNQLLVSESTKHLVDSYFEFEKWKSVRFANSLLHVEVYHLLKERAHEAFSQLSASSSNRKMHGREEQLTKILKAWEGVGKHAGAALLITGEAGIGKSKLVQEVKEKINAHACASVEVKCLPENRSNALSPLFDLLRKHYGWHESLGPEITVPRLKQMLMDAGEGEEALPVLLAWLGIAFETIMPLELSPSEQKSRLFALLKKCIAHIATDRNTLLIVEDLHWIDPTSKEWFSEWLCEGNEKHFLCLFTSRTEEGLTLLPCERVSLLPLSDEMAKRIVEQMVGRMVDPPSLASIIQRADGVPIFIEELTSMLLERNELVWEGDRYRLVHQSEWASVPITLTELLQARLDLIGPAKETAQWAATIGREFSYDVLVNIATKAIASVEADLADLIQADLVYPMRTVKGTVYVFRHALFCDAAYQTQSISGLEQTHQRIADVLIENIDIERLQAADAEKLATHLYGAHQTEQALDWLDRSIQALARKSANRECIQLCHKALLWLNVLAVSDERNNREFAIRQVLITNLVMTESYGSNAVGEQLDMISSVYDRLLVQKSLLPSMYVYSTYYLMRGDWKEATRVAQQQYEHAVLLNEVKYIIVSSAFLGIQLMNDAQFLETEQILEHALALYDPSVHDELMFEFGIDQEVLACCALASVSAFLGKWQRSVMAEERVMQKVARLAHVHTSASAYLGLSCTRYYLGDKSGVEAYSQLLLTLNEQTSMSMFGRYALILHGWATNDLEQASKALEQEEASGMRSMRSFWHSIVADLEIEAGQWEQAKKRLYNCLSFIGTTDGTLCEADIHRLLGKLFLATHKTNVGLEHLELATRLAANRQAQLTVQKCHSYHHELTPLEK